MASLSQTHPLKNAAYKKSFSSYMNTKIQRMITLIKNESRPVQALLATVVIGFCYAVFVTLGSLPGAVMKAAIDDVERPAQTQPQPRPEAPVLEAPVAAVDNGTAEIPTNDAQQPITSEDEAQNNLN